MDKVMEGSSDVLCALDQNGYFAYLGQAWQEVLGYAPEELDRKNFLEVISPADQASTLAAFQNTLQGKRLQHYLNRYLHKEGFEVPIFWSVVWSEQDQLMYCHGRVAQDLLRAQQQLQIKEGRHKALVDHGPCLMGLLNEAAEFTYLEEPGPLRFKYQTYQLLGSRLLDWLHPEDVALATAAWEEVKDSEVVQVPDVRFKAGNGAWRWVEAVISNHLQNPMIRAFVITCRDITERKQAVLQLEESEQRFRSLFDSNPDMMIYEDRAGNILDANAQFIASCGLPKEEIITRNLREIIPQDALAPCLHYLEKAFQGEIVTFDLQVNQPDKPPTDLRVTKMPVLGKDGVKGVHTIAKDITEKNQTRVIIRKQAEALLAVFESITDAFFMLDHAWCFQLINKETERILQLDRQECLGESIWELLPILKTSAFFRYFHQAVETGQAVHFETYLERYNLWFEVKAYPSEEGLSVYFSDITERIQAKKELEKLSLVASKISNGVIITDAAGRIEWVNEAFTRNTGFRLEEVKSKIPGTFVLGPDSDLDVGQQIIDKLQLGKPFHISTLNYRKTGEKVWFAMDFTPILNEEQAITRHIVIQKDITFRKEAEEKQLEMTRDLYRQNRDFQQFTYIVSHNLRAPVANAMGLAEFLSKQDKNSDTYDQSLAYLKTSVFKMDTVLRDLSLILSLRDKQDVLEREMVAVAEVCEQVRQYFLESLMHHKGELKVEMDTSIRLNTNRAYLYSIFYNLLSNAIKYRAEGRALQVMIQCHLQPEGGVVIHFSDNGSGFDMAKAGDNVFKLYKRFHLNKKGRGMGLFLVKTHVESMGGTIKMTSKLNEGTQVTIQLPGEISSHPSA
ncbi:hypothetical protein GCM10011405_27350 [Rufibacter glacialis]|nr:hypothetical protein GCM10011405_27350 [Rufibacter glacialis]